MKNRKIQFLPTAGLLIPLLLAFFAVLFSSHSRASPRRGAFNGIVVGTQFISVLCELLRSYNPRVQFRRREPIGSLHWNGGILPPSLRTQPGSL